MIILDIDMPKNCWDCTLNVRCSECESYPDWCAAKGMEESKECEYGKDSGRPDWCPIVGEIPKEHGRLIDADELIKDDEVTEWISIIFKNSK